MPLISTYRYDGSGNLSIEYDERGDIDCSTEYSYDRYGTLKSVDLPDGQKINYDNGTVGLLSVSSPLGTETSVNKIFSKRGLVTKTTSDDSEFEFTYDGFGNVVKTELNGATISETEYKRDSAYSSTDETTFNYVKHTYRNGNGNDYSEKTITDKDGNVVCVLGDRYDENGTKTTVEIMRVGYDEYGRTETVTDKSLCNFDNAGGSSGDAIVYTNVYSDDGELKNVVISGEITGGFSETTDETGKVVSKTITHIGNTKTYGYNYDEYNGEAYPDNRISEIRLPNDAVVSCDYDAYSRLVQKSITPCQSGSAIVEGYAYLRGGNDLNCGCKDRETNYVSNIFYHAADYSSISVYNYDNRGNISSATEDEVTTQYTYDQLNRLKTERNSQTDVLTTYEYDKSGNITKILKTCRGSIVEDCSFSYGADGRLTNLSKFSTSFSPKEYNISYDNVGNPCNYKDNVLKWERGRLLAAYGDNKFSYNADGIRIKKKTAEDVLHTYFVEGTRIHCERFLNHTNWYYYDATGITGMEHDGVRYFFQKNVQGDVMRIFDSCGRLVARYAYDAWGNHTVYDANGNAETAYNFIGNINPFRYRGYYFDVETGLYYLNTRYYDPSICRFINADDISYIEPETINGLNLYSYCLNNPIFYVDPDGHAPIPWWGKLLIGIGVVLVGAVVTALTAGTGAGFMSAFGAALLTSAKAVAISTAISAGIGLTVGGITTGTWEGAFNGMLDGAVDGFMWGGIFAGGAQVLSGVFKGVATIANNAGKLQTLKQSPIFSPDRLKGAKEIAGILKKGQKFYDYGGTLVRIGKFAHIDVSTKALLHLAVFGFKHIPIGTVIAGIIGGF